MKAGDTPSVINESTVKLLPFITEEYVEKSKFDRWCSFFFDKNNPETYLNRTRSAMKVYDVKNYQSAGQIGYQNFKKVENWQSILRNYSEEIGVTVPVIYRKVLKKFETTNNTEWLKIAMRMQGQAELVDEQRQTLVQNNLQMNQSNQTIQVVNYKDASKDDKDSVQVRTPQVPVTTA